MNAAKIKAKLAKQYQGANIKENKDPETGDVVEIIAEIDRKLVGSDRDVAIVVADRVLEHYHKQTTEEYEVIEGELTVYLDGKPRVLKKGESIVTPPGTKHRSIGHETWFYCYSEPDWTAEDYYPVET